MGLEDVVQGVSAYKSVSDIAKQTNYQQMGQQILGSLLYLGDKSGFSQEEIQRMAQVGLNPEQIGAISNDIASKVEAKFISDTKGDLKDFLEKLPPELLIQYGLKYGEEAKEMEQLEEAIKKSDMETVRALTFKRTKDGKVNQDSPYNRLFHATANYSQLQQIGAEELQKKAAQFQQKYFFSEVEGEEGKIAYDPEKAVKYVAGAINKVGKDAYIDVAEQVSALYAAAQSRQAAPDNAMAA